MNRRDMIMGSLLASLGARSAAFGSQGTEPPLQSRARHQGPFFLFIELRGGWDPTQVCVPLDARISGSDPAKAKRIGPFSVPDHSHWPQDRAGDSKAILQFFEMFQNDLLQVDGVFTSTLTHEFGQFEINMGTSRSVTYPNLFAAIAASLAPSVPMPYLTNSGHAATAGLVQAIPTYDMARMRSLLNPSSQGPTLGPSAWARVMEQLDKRLEARAQAGGLQHTKDFYAAMARSHRSVEPLRELEGLMNELIGQGVSERFALAIAAFELGLSATAQVTYHGFDTHDEHFSRQPVALGNSFRDTTTALRVLKSRGLLERTTVIIGSEFARTASYGAWDTARPLNATNGKDHWQHASLLFLGRGITGNRRLGSFNERQVSQRVDFETLQPRADGQLVTLPQVHQAIRDFAGVTPTINERFPLRVTAKPKIFG
jgi:hypothetical protein